MHRRGFRREWLAVIFIVATVFWFTIFLSPPKQEFKQTNLPSGIHYYRYQKPYLKYSRDSTSYEVVLVADKDKASKNSEKKNWETVLRGGTLSRLPSGNYTFAWHSRETILETTLAEAGRALELSELVYFVDRLYSPDDRTGVVFSIEDDKAIPTYILMDGNGRTTKGFKSEWATVKDGLMYIGSVGKEYTTNEGEIVSRNPQWVKTIDAEGRIKHLDWSEHYTRLREASGTMYPGYLIHEAVTWNPVLQRWIFFPRRHSMEAYNDVDDESRGSNVVITATEDFVSITVDRIGTLTPIRGFSSVAYLPGRETHIVALKSQEYKDSIASYILVLDLETKSVLMEEMHIADIKLEGIEIM
eukprot:TRINITY_DN21630_c0_g1_i1.p1 TRINITY_DN21630_c0_g1~~TRINITY_DN21630_c0_g1_i1.p1  ORF type:complete len:358 (-),score=85.72 TRINITY_DN21630_c0_g1_i1:54-1127(-)